MKWSADNSYLLEYLGRIESGEIPAGQDMWMELDNLKEDMLSGEYTFDRKDALIRINFIENCVKLTKSPFYGQPMQLMLWQKAFIEAVYSFKMADGFDRFLFNLMVVAGDDIDRFGIDPVTFGKFGPDLRVSPFRIVIH